MNKITQNINKNQNKLPSLANQSNQQTIYLMCDIILFCYVKFAPTTAPFFTVVVFVQVLLSRKASPTLFALEGLVSNSMHTFMPPEVPRMQEAHWASLTLVGPFKGVCFDDMHC